MSIAFDKSTVVKEYKEEIETLQKDKDALAKKVGNLTIEKDFLEGKLVSLVLKDIPYLFRSIENYINIYNAKRLHSAIDYKIPNKVYYQAINNLGKKGVKLLPKVS